MRLYCQWVNTAQYQEYALGAELSIIESEYTAWLGIKLIFGNLFINFQWREY